jgi:predicted phosphodiesterase
VLIALISDIHGNLLGLEAVLADLSRRPVQRVVYLGDVAATGPQPHETIARLRALGPAVVMGNTDAWLLNPEPKNSADEDRQRIMDIDLWCARQLTSDDRDYLSTFAATVELDLGDEGKLLGFHGSPHSYDGKIFAETPAVDLDHMLLGFSATVMACGHTHIPLMRRHQGALIVNPGSAGMPYEFGPEPGQVRNPPWAEYARVNSDHGQLSIELVRVPLNAAAVRVAALESGMPHAAWWAQDWR